MAKLIFIGSSFIQEGETLFNLKGYQKIEKYNFGLNEDPERNLAFGIKFTPLMPSKEDHENGVDGSFILTEYTFDEENEFKQDFDSIISALKD